MISPRVVPFRLDLAFPRLDVSLTLLFFFFRYHPHSHIPLHPSRAICPLPCPPSSMYPPHRFFFPPRSTPPVHLRSLPPIVEFISFSRRPLLVRAANGPSGACGVPHPGLNSSSAVSSSSCSRPCRAPAETLASHMSSTAVLPPRYCTPPSDGSWRRHGLRLGRQC